MWNYSFAGEILFSEMLKVVSLFIEEMHDSSVKMPLWDFKQRLANGCQISQWSKNFATENILTLIIHFNNTLASRSNAGLRKSL